MGIKRLATLALLALLGTLLVACGREQGIVPATLTAIAPSSGVQGQTVAVTLTGTNFVTGATVNVGGALITVSSVTVVSGNEITATFAIAANAALGAVNVTVTTAGVTTNAVTFTVGPPALISIAPASGVQGQTVAVTLTGTNFASGSTVNVGGALVAVSAVTVVSATKITANFAIAANAALGIVNVSVTSAGVTTNTVVFTVGPPTLTAIAPSSGIQGQTVAVTLTGTNFVAGAAINVNGAGITVTATTVVSATQITASFAVAPTAAVGIANISVTSSGVTTNTVAFTIVPPTLTSISPARAIQGQTLGVILTGTNFAAGATVNVGGALITVSQVTVNSPTSISAIFAVAANAAVGAVNVTVTSAGATTNIAAFTVALPLAVSSTIPAAGATGVPVNQVVSVTFSQPLLCSTVTATSFTLLGGSAAPSGTISCSGTTATFTLAAGQLLQSNTPYTGTLTTAITNALGDPMSANFTFSFTTALAPAVTSTSPGSGATGVPVTQPPVTATFNQPVLCSTVTAANVFTVSSASGPVAGAVTCTNSTATFTPTGANLAFNTTYTALISKAVTNAAGAPMAAAYQWMFVTAPAPPVAPVVISTVPVNNASGVAINAQVSATFNEALDPASISASTFTLTGPGGVSVTPTSVTYSANGSIATFTPPTLSGLTTYVATLTVGVKAFSTETPMAANYTFTFTTGLAPVTTKPTILFTVPASAATNVPANQAISATFSEPMNPATIVTVPPAAATFTVTGPSGPVTGLVTYSGVSNTATFTPTSNLQAGATYTAMVSTAAQDLSVPGNSLGAGGVPNPWSFTVAAAASTAPTITATSPVNNAASVPLNATVSATFSQPMNPLTFTTDAPGATFNVTNGGVLVPGTVAYNPATSIATFTPASALTAGATYIVTISSGAQNTLTPGVGLNTTGGSPDPWSFTTIGAVAPAINLGTAAAFGAFGGGAGITNQGINTIINGNIGTTAVSTKVTGFNDAAAGCVYTETTLNIGAVNGTIYTAPPNPTPQCPQEGTGTASPETGTFGIATQAAADALSAYNQMAAVPCTVCSQGAQLASITLTPGVYKSASGSFLIGGGDLTLDAQGNPNAVWIFQTSASGSLTVGNGVIPSNVILKNGALPQNVYWYVGSAATINGVTGGGTMVGTIISSAGSSISTATAGNVLPLVTLNGQILALNASVTMVNTVINVPLP